MYVHAFIPRAKLVTAVSNKREECICRVVRETARSLTNAYDRALGPSGIKTTQFTVLSVLDRESTASIGELSELLGLDQTTTTRNLMVLEDAGLVTRVAHHDPRVKLLKLTARGRQKRLTAEKYWQDVQAKVRSKVSASEWQAFRKVLKVINGECKELLE